MAQGSEQDHVGGAPGGGIQTVQGPTPQATQPGTTAPVLVGGVLINNGQALTVQIGTQVDGSGAGNGLIVESRLMVWNGASAEKMRTSTTFKNVVATVITSETTVWTPAGGKKFRLMGYCLTQGVVTGAITLKDNTAGSTILVIPQHTIGANPGFVSLGNGILSGAADRVLTATGASTETITGYFFGTEE